MRGVMEMGEAEGREWLERKESWLNLRPWQWEGGDMYSGWCPAFSQVTQLVLFS